MTPASAMDTSIVVPGLDHSLPPVIAAPLSALDDSSPARLGFFHHRGGLPPSFQSPSPRGLHSSIPREANTPTTPEQAVRAVKKRRRHGTNDSCMQNMHAVHAKTMGEEPAPKKPRKSFSYWTAAELRLLLEGICMVGADFDRVASIVGMRDSDACRKQVSAVAARVRAKFNQPPCCTKDECVATVLSHVKVPLPAPAPKAARKSRRGPRLQYKISIQAVPVGKGDAEIVTQASRNPCVEVVLRAHRSVWDVVSHLYAKWGHPLQLLMPGESSPLCVDDSVGSLNAELGEANGQNVVRVSYRFVRPNYDPYLLGNPGGKYLRGNTVCNGPRMRVKIRRRTYAPPGRLFTEDDYEDEELELVVSQDELPRKSASNASNDKNCKEPNVVAMLMEQVSAQPEHALVEAARKADTNLQTYQPKLDSLSDGSSSIEERSIEEIGTHVMGKWKARLDSLQSVPALPRTEPKTGASTSAARPAITPGVASGMLAIGSTRDESLAFAASELAAETSATTSKSKRMSIQDHPHLSGSLFGNASLFKIDTHTSVDLKRPSMPSLFGSLSALKPDGHANIELNKSLGPRTPLREGLLLSDNALDLHASPGDESSQSPLPPRLNIGGTDPSLNFSLLFGDHVRADNSGLVP